MKSNKKKSTWIGNLMAMFRNPIEETGSSRFNDLMDDLPECNN